MILQEKNYIKSQQKKYLLYGIIWTVVVFTNFIIGLVLTGTRKNLFTVGACVIAIVASLYITRYISFRRYKDGDISRAEQLEKMQGSYHIYHSAIIPTEKETAYFEHIVVTKKNVYFIAYTKEQVEKYRQGVQEVVRARGISIKQLCFLVAKDGHQMEKHIRRIEQEVQNREEEVTRLNKENTLEVYSNKINEILM